jgi:drug/metabolite transporter (DMT)-like permease
MIVIYEQKVKVLHMKKEEARLAYVIGIMAGIASGLSLAVINTFAKMAIEGRVHPLVAILIAGVIIVPVVGVYWVLIEKTTLRNP